MKKAEQNRFNQYLGVSLPYALSQLRDRQGDIHIHLPIQGDSRSPDFKLRDVFWVATRNALKQSVISYYAPLGVTFLTGVVLPPGSVFLAEKLVDWVAKLRFNPVEFKPMTAELSDDNRAYLDKTAALLKDRPKVDMLICGKAVSADLLELRKAETKKDADAEKGGALSAQEKWQLLELAKKRTFAVKDFLVSKGIKAQRILICSPVIDLKDKGGPVVTLAI